eukprot:TRINITY_DN1049_c0_g1_i1.p1 TRINITY_DN1049_c0_g1~~TRINITY_DN1049_c0_g1_i1.p1  ORF type:complete len:698 (-),score=137.66 TRINITY_DN1049_c0_g1_i1:523-2616(-)
MFRFMSGGFTRFHKLSAASFRTIRSRLLSSVPSSISKPAAVKTVKPDVITAAERVAVAKGEGVDRGTRGDMRALGTLASHLWPAGESGLKARVVISLSMLITGKLLTVYVPFFFKHAVDALTNSAPINASTFFLTTPIALLIGYGVARATAAAFNELRAGVFSKVAQTAIRKMALQTFRHLHHLDLSFHLERDTGSLSNAINRGVRSINFVLTALTFNVLPTFFEISLVIGVLGVKYGIVFSGIAFATLALYIAFTVAVTTRRTKIMQQKKFFENKASQRAFDSLINFETVKYFNNEELEAKRYDDILKQFQKASIRTQTSLGLLNFGQNLIFSAALASVMVFAASGVLGGVMTVGDLVMVNGLIFQLSIPLNFVGTVYRELRQALIDMDAMIAIHHVTSTIADKPEAKELQLKEGSASIEFQNVDFSYADSKPILQSLTFKVPAGQTVALVGSSGSGKSTLLRLLYRFFDPLSGIIRIDSQDIRDVKVDSLRRAIGVVPQDTMLFNDTIYYNIHYGNPTATREQVIEAAKLARVHDSIMSFPKGYDTVVGERGVKLSGGEKQRVAIARMILKRPSIVICDEPTSSLDTQTEHEILANLREVAHGRTTIIVAHRLSTIVDSDIIFVFENGKVVEQGKHSDLLNIPNGRYARMWELQAQTQRVNGNGSNAHLPAQRIRLTSPTSTTPSNHNDAVVDDN